MTRPQPRPSPVAGAKPTWVTATALWSTWTSQPAAPSAGGPSAVGHDGGRGDQVEGGLERVFQVEDHAQAERPLGLARRRRAGCRASGRRACGGGPGRRRAGRCAGGGSRCRGHRASRGGRPRSSRGRAGSSGGASRPGRARPSGRPGSGDQGSAWPAGRSSRGRGRSSVTSISRIGRPVQSRYRWRNPASREPSRGSTSVPPAVPPAPGRGRRSRPRTSRPSSG